MTFRQGATQGIRVRCGEHGAGGTISFITERKQMFPPSWRLAMANKEWTRSIHPSKLPPELQSFANRVADRIEELAPYGITQRGVARRLGWQVATLNRLLKGQTLHQVPQRLLEVESCVEGWLSEIRQAITEEPAGR